MKSIIVLLGSVLLLCASARAQKTAPVFVQFTFDSEGVKNTVDKIKILEATIGERLADKCGKGVGVWNFQAFKPGTLPDTQYPRLRVEVIQAIRWRMRVTLLKGPGQPHSGLWFSALDFFKPEDFDRFPNTHEPWISRVGDFFDAEILEKIAGDITRQLRKSAALGRKINLVVPGPIPGADPREFTVLPLGWAEYEMLSASEFSIQCRSSAGTVTLKLVGLGLPARYTPAQPAFDGLVTRLKRWHDPAGPSEIAGRLSELSSLQPFAFFLDELHEPGWDVGQ